VAEEQVLLHAKYSLKFGIFLSPSRFRIDYTKEETLITLLV